ncbi:hypothetical protein C8R45DRAFT_933928 [Mycena sanguinolenta]|nr:hypothetical protein C8R45DRAFT_933928 [Mycena sanguinolenta]
MSHACNELSQRALALNHIKEGRPLAAEVIHPSREANFMIFIPHGDKYPELARMCIGIPDHEKPHRHPVPPLTKVSHAFADKYKKCVRKYGVGTTVGSEAFQEAQIIGKTNMYEINEWLMPVNEFFMDTRDRPAFKFIWEEFQPLVKRLSRHRKCKLASHLEQPDGRLPNLSAHLLLIGPFFTAY